MNGIGKINLRQRKINKHFDSDNQENDHCGYARYSYQKDHKTPAQILHAQAKMLVKFINNANKAARSAETQARKKDIEIKQPVVVRGSKPNPPIQTSSSRKRQQLSIEKPQLTKKSKDWQKSLNNAPNSDTKHGQKNEAILNKIKNMSMQSATNMRMLQLSMTKGKNETQSKIQVNTNRNLQESNLKSKGISSQNTKNNENNSKPTPFCKDKQKMKKIHEVEDKLNLQRSDFSSKNKIFKRSSYHVAIAYHIYLKKLAQRGQLTGEIDPTTHARRLKEGMSDIPY